MQKAIEAGWLVAAVLIPVAVTHEDFMVSSIAMPKVFVLRTLALYPIAAVAYGGARSRQPPAPHHLLKPELMTVPSG